MKTAILVIAVMTGGVPQPRLAFEVKGARCIEDVLSHQAVVRSYADDMFPGQNVVMWCREL